MVNSFASSHEVGSQSEPQRSSQAGAQQGLFPGLFRNNLPVSMPPTGGPSSHTPTASASSDYNGHRIPGLGMSSSVLSSLSFSTNDGKQNKAVTRETKPQNRIDRDVPARTQPSSFTGLQAQLKSQEVADEALEEGELTEGESEDFYEPPGANEMPPEQLPRPLQVAAVSRTGSLGDADGSSIYDTGSTRDEIVIDSTSASLPGNAGEDEEEYSPDAYEPEYQARGQTGSYSPHLSPIEVQTSNALAAKTLQPSDSKHVATFSIASGAGPRQSDLVVQTEERQEYGQIDGGEQTRETAPMSGLPYKSLLDAKKKAQEAILGLWHAKVRYQDYVEEGFDESVVKSLFTDLGLATSQPGTTLSNDTTKPLEVSKTGPAPLAAVSSSASRGQLAATPPPLHPVVSGSKATAAKSAGEERKDRIARVLAEKKRKNDAAAALKPVLPAKPTEPAAAAPAMTLSAKDKMNMKLQEKLAALRRVQDEEAAKRKRQQEQQVQELLDTERSKSASAGATNSSNVLSAMHAAADQGATSEPKESLSDGLETPNARLIIPTAQDSKNRNVKRPVASDFDSYQTHGSLKRTRTQETLIIDVSDDEDVEMEIASPSEPPPGPAVKENGVGPIKPMLLSDTLSQSQLRQQHSSPASSVQTPLEQPNKLHLLHKRIEETKRRIAEAEAKKVANKQSNGTTTPALSTPLGMELGRSSKIAELANASRQLKDGRRDRIVSYELPQVEASIRDKQDRLQRLHAETAKLELEVQMNVAEQQKLTLEMEQLGEPDVSEPNESDSQHAGAADATAALPKVPAVHAAALGASALSATTGENGAEGADEPGYFGQRMEVDDDQLITDTRNNTNLDADGHSLNDGRPPLSEDQEAFSLESNAPSAGSKSEEALLSLSGGPLPGTLADLAEHADLGHVLTDAESSLQNPVAELSVSEEDTSEHIKAQLSSTDKPPVSESEEGEVMPIIQKKKAPLIKEQISDDADNYKPEPAPDLHSPAQPARAEQQPPPGEVERDHGVSVPDLTSYISPLRNFHAFKYHPTFLAEVPGGLRSLTYSSRIDPNKPLCPYVLAGEVCLNGANCEFQHFDQMGLLDSEIITELGSAEKYAGAQKALFIDGLKKVLSDLKANKVKDFDRITRAILAYRSSFRGDESRILPLDGVVI